MNSHVMIIHGYLLNHSGSCTYVRNLAFGFAQQGYSVTICCQDHNAALMKGINKMYFDPKEALPIPGKVNVLVPMKPYKNHILPVYIYNYYNGFNAKTILSMKKYLGCV